MPQATPTLYSAGRFALGGRVYLREELIREDDVKLLSQDEIDFYKRRGILTPNVPRNGSVQAASVPPMTTHDAPNAPPAEQQPQQSPGLPAEHSEPVAEPAVEPDAAKLLAERQRLAQQHISSKRGK